jgi:hypothetical protein
MASVDHTRGACLSSTLEAGHGRHNRAIREGAHPALSGRQPPGRCCGRGQAAACTHDWCTWMATAPSWLWLQLLSNARTRLGPAGQCFTMACHCIEESTWLVAAGQHPNTPCHRMLATACLCDHVAAQAKTWIYRVTGSLRACQGPSRWLTHLWRLVILCGC